MDFGQRVYSLGSQWSEFMFPDAMDDVGDAERLGRAEMFLLWYTVGY